MKYSVDKIENDIVVLEDIETKEKINVNKKEIPFIVNEKDILRYKNNEYIKDNDLKDKRIKMLREKMERLKKGSNYGKLSKWFKKEAGWL